MFRRNRAPLYPDPSQPRSVVQAAAQAIAGLFNRDEVAQQAEMQAAPSFAQAAAAQAQARQADAMAGKIGAETEGLRLKNDLQRDRGANSIQAALDLAGAVGQARQALPRFRETGTWGAPVENPALAGPPMEGFNAPTSPAQAPAGVNDQMLRAFMATLGATGLGAVDGGNSTADNLVGAARKILEERTRGDLLGAGPVTPQSVALTEMAMKGTSPYNFNEYGVGNTYTGAVDVSNPAAQRFGDYRAASTGAQKANATQSLAAAGASNAQAGKYRAEADVERARVAGTLPAPAAPAVKPMPAPAVKAQNEELSTIGQFAGLDADLGAVEKQMADGKLNFGPVSNVLNTGRNFVGMSSEQSRNFASFKAKMENMRNAVLLLNKGVQTEGDAQRAMNEVMSNLNDPGVVSQRLAEIRALNRRAVELRKQNVALIRSNFGQPELDFSAFERLPAAANLNDGGTPRVSSDAEYNALPPGATYIAPDGSTRRKP